MSASAARRTALSFAAGGALLVTGVLTAAPASAASRYACSVVSAPTSVRLGTVYTVKYRYSNTSETLSTWTGSNTNPVMMLWDPALQRMKDGAWTSATYTVGRGGSVTITFSRGTASQVTGKILHQGRMYHASGGNTTSLMAGSMCQHTITFYR